MKTVSILGMHRCGTSLASRIVNLLGVDLGPSEQLMRPQPDNPRGFWENRPLVRFNNRLLEHLGGTWDRPPVLPDGWEHDPHLDELGREARTLFEAAFGGTQARTWGLVGWKDPRMSLLLPFWRRIIQMDRVIICIRHPAEVSASLHARNGLDGEEGAYLWLRYLSAAYRHEPSAFVVDYSDFFTALPETVDQLVSYLAVAAPQTHTWDAIRETVDRELYHHTAPAQPPTTTWASRAQALFHLMRREDRRWVTLTADLLHERWCHEAGVVARSPLVCGPDADTVSAGTTGFDAEAAELAAAVARFGERLRREGDRRPATADLQRLQRRTGVLDRLLMTITQQ